MTINNKIGSGRIFAGFTWGEAIRHATKPEESDTWIAKVTKWDRSSESIYDYKTIFSHYELKTYGAHHNRDRSLRVPKTLNSYVEKVIKDRKLSEIEEYHNIYIK